jgi:hypothetical protein
LEELSENFDATLERKSYLRVNFNTSGTVFNSCIYDNRVVLGNIEEGDGFALRIKYKGAGAILDCGLGDYTYQTSGDYYSPMTVEKIKFDSPNVKEGKIPVTSDEYVFFRAISSDYTKKEFRKSSQIRLWFEGMGECYIEEIELFKTYYTDDGVLITPNTQADTLDQRVINKTYYYFNEESLKGITSEDELKPIETSKSLLLKKYKPKFNDGAQKVRSIEIKESNYFNILQTLAETFQAWLSLDVIRDETTGKVTKAVSFKNYLAGKNQAGFRYGVNLDNIQRTYGSKEIVTKLIVKPNSNEYATNGFCTIARANSNPTGETSIFDFRYHQDVGLMDARQFLENAYTTTGAEGEDLALYLEMEIQYSNDGETWENKANNETKYY